MFLSIEKNDDDCTFQQADKRNEGANHQDLPNSTFLCEEVDCLQEIDEE